MIMLVWALSYEVFCLFWLLLFFPGLSVWWFAVWLNSLTFIIHYSVDVHPSIDWFASPYTHPCTQVDLHSFGEGDLRTEALATALEVQSPLLAPPAPNHHHRRHPHHRVTITFCLFFYCCCCVVFYYLLIYNICLIIINFYIIFNNFIFFNDYYK